MRWEKRTGRFRLRRTAKWCGLCWADLNSRTRPRSYPAPDMVVCWCSDTSASLEGYKVQTFGTAATYLAVPRSGAAKRWNIAGAGFDFVS